MVWRRYYQLLSLLAWCVNEWSAGSDGVKRRLQRLLLASRRTRWNAGKYTSLVHTHRQSQTSMKRAWRWTERTVGICYLLGLTDNHLSCSDSKTDICKLKLIAGDPSFVEVFQVLQRAVEVRLLRQWHSVGQHEFDFVQHSVSATVFGQCSSNTVILIIFITNTTF